MNKLAVVSAVAGGLTAAVLGLAAPAAAGPSASADAEQTISALEQQGYRVIVNRVGSTPLSEATVVAVRPGHQVPTLAPDRDGDVVQQVAYTTIYVDVK